MHIRALSVPEYQAWVKNLAAWDPNPIYLTAQNLVLKDSPPGAKNVLSGSPSAHAPLDLPPASLSSHTRSSSLSDPNVAKEAKELSLNESTIQIPALAFGAGPITAATRTVTADFELVKSQTIALGRAIESGASNSLAFQQKTYSSVLKLQHSLQETLRLMQDIAIALDWAVRDDNRNRSLLGMSLLAQPGDDIAKLASALAKRPSIYAPSSIADDEYFDAVGYHGTPPVSDDEADSDEDALGNQVTVASSDWQRTREKSSSHILLPESTPPLVAAPVVRRKALPTTGSPESPVSIVGILRKNMGKDLSTIAMPVSLNEPLSALQRYISNR